MWSPTVGIGAHLKPGKRYTQKERKMEVDQQTLPKSKCIVKVSWTVHGPQDIQFTFSGFRSQLYLNFCGLHLLLHVLNDVTKILKDSVKKNPYIINPVHNTSGQSHIYHLLTLNLYLSLYLQAGHMPLMSPFQFAEKFIIHCGSIIFLDYSYTQTYSVFYMYFLHIFILLSLHFPLI